MGYSINNERVTNVVYDLATGQIMGVNDFNWTFLRGTLLRNRINYPKGDGMLSAPYVEWEYEEKRDLVSTIKFVGVGLDKNHGYVYDKLGRMICRDEVQYRYNARNELIMCDEACYTYDDAGNRLFGEGTNYETNMLNQYTCIGEFVPQYDADGNQTLLQTSTGIWEVFYNAENRPVLWRKDDIEIVMSYDRMGRRLSYTKTKSGSIEHNVAYLYNDYFCVEEVNAVTNETLCKYIWEPIEVRIERPCLLARLISNATLFYFNDANKNVLIEYPVDVSEMVRYSYSAFGETNIKGGNEGYIRRERILPTFSSEFYDSVLGLIYYNYRHYNPTIGRWCTRDPLLSQNRVSKLAFLEYGFLNNMPLNNDWLGLLQAIAEQHKPYKFIYSDALVVNDIQYGKAEIRITGDFVVLFDSVACEVVKTEFRNTSLTPDTRRVVMQSPNSVRIGQREFDIRRTFSASAPRSSLHSSSSNKTENKTQVTLKYQITVDYQMQNESAEWVTETSLVVNQFGIPILVNGEEQWIITRRREDWHKDNAYIDSKWDVLTFEFDCECPPKTD